MRSIYCYRKVRFCDWVKGVCLVVGSTHVHQIRRENPTVDLFVTPTSTHSEAIKVLDDYVLNYIFSNRLAPLFPHLTIADF